MLFSPDHQQNSRAFPGLLNSLASPILLDFPGSLGTPIISPGVPKRSTSTPQTCAHLNAYVPGYQQTHRPFHDAVCSMRFLRASTRANSSYGLPSFKLKRFFSRFERLLLVRLSKHAKQISDNIFSKFAKSIRSLTWFTTPATHTYMHKTSF